MLKKIILITLFIPVATLTTFAPIKTLLKRVPSLMKNKNLPDRSVLTGLYLYATSLTTIGFYGAYKLKSK